MLPPHRKQSVAGHRAGANLEPLAPATAVRGTSSRLDRRYSPMTQLGSQGPLLVLHPRTRPTSPTAKSTQLFGAEIIVGATHPEPANADILSIGPTTGTCCVNYNQRRSIGSRVMVTGVPGDTICPPAGDCAITSRRFPGGPIKIGTSRAASTDCLAIERISPMTVGTFAYRELKASISS